MVEDAGLFGVVGSLREALRFGGVNRKRWIDEGDDMQMFGDYQLLIKRSIRFGMSFVGVVIALLIVARGQPIEDSASGDEGRLGRLQVINAAGLGPEQATTPPVNSATPVPPIEECPTPTMRPFPGIYPMWRLANLSAEWKVDEGEVDCESEPTGMQLVVAFDCVGVADCNPEDIRIQGCLAERRQVPLPDISFGDRGSVTIDDVDLLLDQDCEIYLGPECRYWLTYTERYWKDAIETPEAIPTCTPTGSATELQPSPTASATELQPSPTAMLTETPSATPTPTMEIGVTPTPGASETERKPLLLPWLRVDS